MHSRDFLSLDSGAEFYLECSANFTNLLLKIFIDNMCSIKQSNFIFDHSNLKCKHKQIGEKYILKHYIIYCTM